MSEIGLTEKFWVDVQNLRAKNKKLADAIKFAIGQFTFYGDNSGWQKELENRLQEALIDTKTD